MNVGYFKEYGDAVTYASRHGLTYLVIRWTGNGYVLTDEE